jgi:hypothetical protein
LNIRNSLLQWLLFDNIRALKLNRPLKASVDISSSRLSLRSKVTREARDENVLAGKDDNQFVFKFKNLSLVFIGMCVMFLNSPSIDTISFLSNFSLSKLLSSFNDGHFFSLFWKISSILSLGKYSNVPDSINSIAQADNSSDSRFGKKEKVSRSIRLKHAEFVM